jgi:hypothetical protein
LGTGAVELHLSRPYEAAFCGDPATFGFRELFIRCGNVRRKQGEQKSPLVDSITNGHIDVENTPLNWRAHGCELAIIECDPRSQGTRSGADGSFCTIAVRFRPL